MLIWTVGLGLFYCTWSQIRSHFFSLSYCLRSRALSGGRFMEFWEKKNFFNYHTKLLSFVFSNIYMFCNYFVFRFTFKKIKYCSSYIVNPASSKWLQEACGFFQRICSYSSCLTHEPNVPTEPSFHTYPSLNQESTTWPSATQKAQTKTFYRAARSSISCGVYNFYILHIFNMPAAWFTIWEPHVSQSGWVVVVGTWEFFTKSQNINNTP